MSVTSPAMLAIGAVVLLLALAGTAAFVLRRRRRRTLRSPEEAVEAAAAALPDLAALDAVVGDDGRAGLVLGTDGRVVVVTATGRAGAVAWSALRQTGEGVVVETGTRRLGKGRLGEILLKGVDALDVRRLGMPIAS